MCAVLVALSLVVPSQMLPSMLRGTAPTMQLLLGGTKTSVCLEMGKNNQLDNSGIDPWNIPPAPATELRKVEDGVMSGWSLPNAGNYSSALCRAGMGRRPADEHTLVRSAAVLVAMHKQQTAHKCGCQTTDG
jgi:hypothetical protein